tara:strand:+ start:1176 stop:2429 length:1254 start_codon:yes stop_codon:yes gene_type:complete
MSKVLVVPYSSASESAKVVADMFNCKRMRLENSNVRDRDDLTLINWGNSTVDLSNLPSAKVLNKPENVKLASHKTKFFQTIEEHNERASDRVNIPDWTTSVRTARQWFNDGFDVVVRHTVQSHSGNGLELIPYSEDSRADQAIPKAPLYTKYMKKRDEYRVHVCNGEAIFVQRKAVDSSMNGVANYQIRNRNNGFIFAIQNLDPDPSVLSNAVNAVKALGLDFGAVDVIWNERRQLATVIEVNTACGLRSESSRDRYYHALKSLIGYDPVTVRNEDVPSIPQSQTESSVTNRVEELLEITSRAFIEEADSMTEENIRSNSLLYNPRPIGTRYVYLNSVVIDTLLGLAANDSDTFYNIQGLSALAHYYNQEVNQSLVYELFYISADTTKCRVKVIPGLDMDLSFHLEIDIPTSLVFWS